MLNVSHLSRRSHHEEQLSLLACIALAATAAKAQPQTAFPAAQTRQGELSGWKRYTVDGERFSVTLPTVPAMTTSRSGTVMLKVVLTSRGTVDNIQVVQAVPGLTEQAIEAARKIKFMPAMKLGKYVSTTLQLEYSLSYS